MADVEQLLHLDINYAAAYNLRGIVHRKQGNIQEAIADFKKAAQLYLTQKDSERCRQYLAQIKAIGENEKMSIKFKISISPETNFVIVID